MNPIVPAVYAEVCLYSEDCPLLATPCAGIVQVPPIQEPATKVPYVLPTPSINSVTFCRVEVEFVIAGPVDDPKPLTIVPVSTMLVVIAPDISYRKADLFDAEEVVIVKVMVEVAEEMALDWATNAPKYSFI